MKRNFFQFVAVAGVLFGGSLSASAAETLKVNVPFSFVLAGLEFQPGEYTLHGNNNGVLTVQGGGQGAMVLTVSSELSRAGSGASVRFVNDGHEYHLVSVQVEGEAGRAIPAAVTPERKLSISSR